MAAQLNDLNGGLFHHPLLGKSTLPVTVVKLHLEASNGVTGLENFIDAALLGQRLCFSQLLGRKSQTGPLKQTQRGQGRIPGIWFWSLKR